MADFETLVERFWDASSDYLMNAPLSAEALARTEQALGVTLPADLVRLLERRNGGRVSAAFNAFPTTSPTSWAPDHVPFNECFGIGDAALTIADSPSLNNEWGQPPELVLLSGDGHWWIALDYRGTSSAEPSVAWYDNEVDQDIELALTFRAFVEGLRPVTDFTP